jgi:hypothetical protein
MIPPWVSLFLELVSGAIALDPQSFARLQTSPHSEQIALCVVSLAAFSQSLAQSIILFINRVSPLRFGISLLISTLLFAFGWLFWGASTLLVQHLLFTSDASWRQIGLTLSLAYAPQLLRIWVALPYFGVPIFILLSIWTFLSFLTGMTTVLGIETWQAFWCGALGWLVVQILQRTIGRPISNVGRWMQTVAAGTPLMQNLEEFQRQMLR